MNLIFLIHPSFLESQSMPRFARMLAEGMQQRNHTVQYWSPYPRFYRARWPRIMKKWLGYVDQYLIFPFEVRSRIRDCSPDTLFVLTDQALGPWVPLVSDRPHVIHCHDFLAQQSALGQIPENPTRWTGRKYQAYIRQGYTQGKCFISGSRNTQKNLHEFLPTLPLRSEVVYNGLNQPFSPMNPAEARATLSQRTHLNLSQGYLLHVGGNQWYKNRPGVIEMYTAWRQRGGTPVPLLMVGAPANPKLLQAYTQSAVKADIHLISGLEDEFVRYAYAGALALLFPSLAEGFGWPIAEAMASGCPVITTQAAPMTEVGSDAAFYVPPRPPDSQQTKKWAREAADVIDHVLHLNASEHQEVVQQGIANAQRFDLEKTLDRLEEIYQGVLSPVTASS